MRLGSERRRVTVIQCFNWKVVLVGPEPGKKRIFESLEEMKDFIKRRRWQANIEHLHPGSGAGELRPESYHFIKNT